MHALLHELLSLLLLLLLLQDGAAQPKEVQVEELRARLAAADEAFLQSQQQHEERDKETLKRQLQELQQQQKKQKCKGRDTNISL